RYGSNTRAPVAPRWEDNVRIAGHSLRCKQTGPLVAADMVAGGAVFQPLAAHLQQNPAARIAPVPGLAYIDELCQLAILPLPTPSSFCAWPGWATTRPWDSS